MVLTIKYSVEISKGLCYYCNEEKNDIKNIILKNEDTINYCCECKNLNHSKILTLQKNEKYFTTYKIIYDKKIRYLTINEYRKPGYLEIFQMFNKKL